MAIEELADMPWGKSQAKKSVQDGREKDDLAVNRYRTTLKIKRISIVIAVDAVDKTGKARRKEVREG